MERVAKRKTTGDEGGASGDSVGGVDQYRLHTAAARGVVSVAIRLLDGGTDINAKDADGDTPLHVACRIGKIKMSTLLLDRGADVGAKAACDGTPLHVACEVGGTKVPALLLDRGAAIEAKALYGRTSLHLVALEGHLNTTKLLIERKAAVDSLDEEGNAPLHFAQNEAVARVLVEAGADVHVRSECASQGDEFGGDIGGGSTPLHLAVDAGVVSVLLKAGADVMAKNDEELTPLHRARNAGVANALLAAGADTEAEDNEGRTPLECARDVEVARSLIDSGADIEHWRVNDESDYVYGTPLVNSVKNEDTSLLLIERGANVSVSYTQEWGAEVSAIWRHVQAGNARVVREMLRKNVVVDWGDLKEAADKSNDEILRLMIKKVGVSVKSGNGSTLLHHNHRNAKLLIDSGADVHARNNFGDTPLHENMFHEVASLLIKNGADIEAVNHKGETPLHRVCEAVSAPGEDNRRMRRYALEKLVVLIKRRAAMDAKRNNGKTPTDLLKITPDFLHCIWLSDVNVKNKA